jgi:hypothetical protein
MGPRARGAVGITLALVLAAAAALGCAKPGDRGLVRGELREVPWPTSVHESRVADPERLFFHDGARRIVGRSFATGKDDLVVDGVDTGEPFTVSASDIVLWGQDDGQPAVVLAPKAGGPARRVRVGVQGVGKKPRVLTGVRGNLTAVRDHVVWTERVGHEDVVVALSTSDPGAVPREVARVEGGGEVIEIGASGSSFALVVRGSETYRIDVGDLASTKLRSAYDVARTGPYHDDDSVDLVVGTAHAYVHYAPNRLYPGAQPLVAVPLRNGESRVVEKRACPGALAVLGDDPVYVLAPGKCPGEFVDNQKLEVVRRHGSSGRTEVVYAAFTGSIGVRAANASTLLLDERISLRDDHPDYRYRMTLLTLR